MKAPLTLREELAEAEAKAAHLKERIAAEGCVTSGHDWRHIGGRNASCSEDCGCSIPVYECTVCGDSDYGENEEAKQKMDACEKRRADEEEDRLRAEDDAIMPGGFN